MQKVTKTNLGHYLAFEPAANKAVLGVNHINAYLSIEYKKTTEDDLVTFIVDHINSYLSRLFFLCLSGVLCFETTPGCSSHTRQAGFQCGAVILKT